MRETSAEDNTLITIFSDSQKALTAIRQPPSQKQNRFLQGQIYYKAEILKANRHTLVCRWTPSNAGIIENKKADLAARNIMEKGGRQVERWSLLEHIKKNLAQVRSTEITKWHESKIQGREVSRRGFYIPWTKAGINPVLRKALKKYAARYYQLKVGHGAVEIYLARMGRIETPQCWWCGEIEQTVGHLYTKCRRWRKARRKLVKKLDKKGIKWQAHVERRWLADLLANEKAVAPLLRFLKAMDVGGREGGREREKEWERRNDQAGEELLGE